MTGVRRCRSFSGPGLFLFPAGFLLLLQAGGWGCSKEDHGTTGGRSVPLGVEVNEVRGPGGDPGLDETYTNVHQGAFSAAQIGLDWADIEASPGERTWQNLDPNLTEVVSQQLRFSVRLLLIDSSGRGRFPSDLDGDNFPGWDDQRLVLRLVRFIRDLDVRLKGFDPRGQGRLSYVWIGSEVDAYFATHRGELAAFCRTLSRCQDSLQVSGSSAHIGTIVAYDGAPALPGVLDSLAASVSRLGLDISGRDAAYQWTLTPAAVMARVRDGVARFPQVPVVLTGVRYPGSTAAGAAGERAFAGLLLSYLADPPGQLDSAFWFSLHDWNSVSAQQMAERRFPADPARAQAYAAELRSVGLRQVDGVAKPVWADVVAWNQAHQSQWSTVATGP
jgi:hypothetical protein